jgi:hypothetical protein
MCSPTESRHDSGMRFAKGPTPARSFRLPLPWPRRVAL